MADCDEQAHCGTFNSYCEAMKTKFYNNRGFSLVELTIAMVVGSIVITGAFKTQVLITKGAVRENQKSSIQQSINS